MAFLSRKHFIALADMMKQAQTLDELKEDIMNWAKSSYPRFDEYKFMEASGMLSLSDKSVNAYLTTLDSHFGKGEPEQIEFIKEIEMVVQ